MHLFLDLAARFAFHLPQVERALQVDFVGSRLLPLSEAA
jgi:hypothetical protein